MTETFKQDKYHTYAWRIKTGEANVEYIYCMEDGHFYGYENGYWKSLKDIDFLGRIEENLKEITKYNLPTRKQIIENFKTIGRMPLEIFNQLPLINFENYMFDPININILAHKKEYYSTIRIPYKYDALAICELWLKTLHEIFEGDINKKKLFQEFIGYCLIPDVRQKKALLLLGDSNSGKSTLLFIIRDLIGNVNCSSVPLKYLSNPQYTPLLINKLVNIDADVDKSAKDYEREFKTITTGEPVSCNQKHIPTFEFVPTCRIIMAANEFPRITDHSSAFYKRLILIPCTRIFEEDEQNKNLVEELKKELPGILNWAIEGLKTLRKRGIFEQYDFMKDAVKELEDDNNPINNFFKEHIEIDIRGEVYIEKGELYTKYKSWADNNREYPLSISRFSSCVYKKFHRYTPKDTQDSYTRKRIWRNIRYLESKIKQENKGWNDPS